MNGLYDGPVWVAHVLAVLGLLELGPALIHSFAPDGGAFAIAGLHQQAGRATIIGLFAWAGATQLCWALIILSVAFRYRVFLRPMLALMALEKSLIALNGWLLKPNPGLHHPPALYAALVAVPFLLALLAASFAPSSRHHEEMP
jgi:hypothetical protein